MTAAPYRVLARAYRPAKLSELIGQEAMVKTLENAFSSGRIAHAFLLTGIRGAGKTTTARIIARGLNCEGPDGRGGPTTEPCGLCPSCVSILEDRSLDVIEMDAATQTSIDDVRELIDGAKYAPSHARYRVYILDEVHMLSIKAFNALLKTLEEPPGHAKFVFATTEVRKVPLTILSRCQRFDLRRIEPEILERHLARLCERERVEAETEALALIAKAGGGSARDAISLLDQAIAMAGGEVTRADVAEMLGMGDREGAIGWLAALLSADLRGALERVDAMHARGADPARIVEDALEIVHEASRAAAEERAEPELEPVARFSIGGLARAWKVLLGGLDEVRNASDPKRALDMLALRLACMGDMPPPGDLARMIASAPGAEAAPSAAPPPTSSPPEIPRSFEALVDALAARGEKLLAAELRHGAQLISYRPKRLELSLASNARADLPGRLKAAFAKRFGPGWTLAIAASGGDLTLAEQASARKRARFAEIEADPGVRKALELFPGSRLIDVIETPTSTSSPTAVETSHEEFGRDAQRSAENAGQNAGNAGKIGRSQS